MSDPVTNVAIEDVLSSIRRLVSEDARVRPLGLRAEPEAPDAPAGKLVLTPALRVSAPAADDAPAQDDAVEAGMAEGQVAADQHAAEEMQAPEAMHDDSPDQAADDHAPDAAAEMAQADEDSVMAWEDHLDDTRDAAPLRLSDAMAADIHEAVIDTDEGAEGAGDAGAAAEDMVSDAGAAHDEWTMSSVTPEEGDAMAADAEDTAAPADFVFASSRDAAGYQDAAGHPADYEAAEDGDIAASIFRDDDTILDEESLRELVAEIVRQELQGALGERITRNVRKLVRREIHRALTSHELE
ncbi:MAG: hypothetical protein LPJ92_10250 [Rhodobacterales bacterium]|nr:hypothetical protein [Rhodobacterales bacterium]MDX5390706.1 hypothetical protein [Rhodobacterales bacterium]MDX5490407.1 hypothetical protein [Rhodobacterales bacterium]